MNIIFVGLLGLSIGACGSTVLDEATSWKDAACACKDKECAEKQGKALIKLGEKVMDADRHSKEEGKKLNKIAYHGQKCLEKHGVNAYDQ